MEIKATLVEISDQVQVSDSFRKREFVTMYAENPTYPEYIKFEAIQDKCDTLNGLSEGQEVTVHFNLKGRKWTNSKGETVYFNSLQAWKIEASVTPHDHTPESDQAQQDAGDHELPF